MKRVRCTLQYMLVLVLVIYGSVTLNIVSWLTRVHGRSPTLHAPATTRDKRHILHQVELLHKQHVTEPLVGGANTNTGHYGNQSWLSLDARGTGTDNQTKPLVGTANKEGRLPFDTNETGADNWTKQKTNNTILHNGSFKRVGNIFVFSAFHDARLTIDKDQPIIRMMAITKQNSEENLVCGYSEGFTTKWILAQKYEMCENHGRMYGGYIFNCNIPTDIPVAPRKVYLQTLTNLSHNRSISVLRSISVDVLSIKPMIIAGHIPPQTKHDYSEEDSVFYEEDVYTDEDIDGNYTEAITHSTASSNNTDLSDNWAVVPHTDPGEDDYRSAGTDQAQQITQTSDLIGQLKEHGTQKELYNKSEKDHNAPNGSIHFSNRNKLLPDMRDTPVNEFTDTNKNTFHEELNYVNRQNRHGSLDDNVTSNQRSDGVRSSRNDSLPSNHAGNEFEDKVTQDRGDNIAYRPPDLSVALCVSPLYGNVRLSQLIQFIEIYKLLGITQFIFYKMHVSRNVDKLLEFYTRRGRVTVIDWKLPDSIAAHRLWNNGQIVAIQDCLHRVMGNVDYVAFVDIDEVIIPRLDSDWLTMLQRLEMLAILDQPDSITAAFSFQSVFFDPNYRDTSMNKLSMLQNLQRTEVLNSVRSKLIVKPEYIMEMGIHHVSRAVNGTFDFVISNVDPNIGLVHHYRECTSKLETEVNCHRDGRLYDDTILKYETPLTKRYYKVLQQNMNKFTKLDAIKSV